MIFLVVCLLSYLTLIYESFKDKNGTKLNGWTAVGSIHKSKEPLLNRIFGDFVTGSLWQKKQKQKTYKKKKTPFAPISFAESMKNAKELAFFIHLPYKRMEIKLYFAPTR